MPIDDVARREVIAATYSYLERARQVYGRVFDRVPVHFDLIGRAAGMYRIDRRGRVIRYNPFLFAKYYDRNLNETVPHEVAHHVVDVMHGRGVRPHGCEWREVMAAFGAPDRRLADFDMAGIPSRRQRRFAYVCACSRHGLSTRAHNRVQSDSGIYLCRRCGGILRLDGG